MSSVLIVGHTDPSRLESSYANAFAQLGWSVSRWNPDAEMLASVRGGRIGQMLTAFVAIEPWVRKMNRKLVLDAMNLRPNLVLVFASAPVRVGALAQLRASVDCSLVLVWPDTLVNWDTHLTAALPLYDLVASYSQRTVDLLTQLGARRVIWCPLAGDPMLHQAQPVSDGSKARYTAAISFVGGWRPERERLLAELVDYDLKIWGPEWGRRARHNAALRRAWQGQALYGTSYAQAIARTRINLNIIDPTNFPAANMRFFEIPTARGLQLASACPEMEGEFGDRKHIFYYHNVDELRSIVDALLHDDETCDRVANTGHQLVLDKHTYVHRTRQILAELGRR